LYYWKVAKNFGQRVFSQHAKLSMAGFVLYLRVCFGLRCIMVRVCPKGPILNLPAGKCGKPRTKTFSPQRAQRSQRGAKPLPLMTLMTLIGKAYCGWTRMSADWGAERAGSIEAYVGGVPNRHGRRERGVRGQLFR
jgi:hypothetical protein